MRKTVGGANDAIVVHAAAFAKKNFKKANREIQNGFHEAGQQL